MSAHIQGTTLFHRPIVFEELPAEMQLRIFSQLGYRDLSICARISRQWQRLSEDNMLWKPLAVKTRYTIAPFAKGIKKQIGDSTFFMPAQPTFSLLPACNEILKELKALRWRCSGIKIDCKLAIAQGEGIRRFIRSISNEYFCMEFDYCFVSVGIPAKKLIFHKSMDEPEGINGDVVLLWTTQLSTLDWAHRFLDSSYLANLNKMNLTPDEQQPILHEFNTYLSEHVLKKLKEYSNERISSGDFNKTGDFGS
jgi:hypothetical protein